MDWNPGPKYQMFLEKIQDILTDEKRTVRDVYYALEARGFPDDLRDESYRRALQRHRDDPDDYEHPDDLPVDDWRWEFKYRYVKRTVKLGRRSGEIDPSLIIDTSRSAENTANAGYDDPEDFIEKRVARIWRFYWENFWRDQPKHVEVWLEKASLASVFEPICDDHNVRLESTRGDWSDSKIYEAAQRLLGKLNDGKQVRILYFGDYNPSGFHAPVAVQGTMAHYGLRLGPRKNPSDDDYFDIWPMDNPSKFNTDDWPDGEAPDIEFERIAINTEHIEEFDLPENPNPSSTDKDQELRERFMRLVSEGRDTNVELNALKEYHRDFLEELIEDSITEHIDSDLREETKDRIRDGRGALSDAISIDRSVVE